MNHTPGPWRVESDNDARDLYICSSQKDDAGSRVATIEPHGWGGAKGIDWSNARLIAAAPDLLAALKRAVDHAATHDDYDWIAAAERAIAKATNK